MIKVKNTRVDLSGSLTDLMTELVFLIDALVRAHAEDLPLTLQQAKVLVELQINNAFEEFIGTDETTKGIESISIEVKIPKGDKDGE